MSGGGQDVGRHRLMAISARHYYLMGEGARGRKSHTEDSVCANVGGGGGVWIFYVIAGALAGAGVGEGVTPLTSSHSRRRAPLPPAALKSLEHVQLGACSNFCINSLSVGRGNF